MRKAMPFDFDANDWLGDARVGMCSSGTRGVYFDLLCAMYVGRCGQVTGTLEQLARIGRCTSADVSCALAELTAAGVVVTQERHGIVTVINEHLRQKCHTRDSAAERKRRSRLKASDGKPVTPESQDGHKEGQKTLFSIDTNSRKEVESNKDPPTPQVQKSVKKPKPPPVTIDQVALPPALETPEVRTAVRDWLAYKARRGESYKDPGYLSRHLASFAGFGPQGLIDAITASIGNNYAGIFPPKQPGGSYAQSPAASRPAARVGPGQRFKPAQAG